MRRLATAQHCCSPTYNPSVVEIDRKCTGPTMLRLWSRQPAPDPRAYPDLGGFIASRTFKIKDPGDGRQFVRVTEAQVDDCCRHRQDAPAKSQPRRGRATVGLGDTDRCSLQPSHQLRESGHGNVHGLKLRLKKGGPASESDPPCPTSRRCCLEYQDERANSEAHRTSESRSGPA